MRMLEPNSTSNNSSVLGGLSGGNHLSGGLSVNSMQTSGVGTIGNLGAHSGAGDRLDASSDSAVSSMGSERVPSLSDGEWGDTGSDSAQDYHQNKYNRPYTYSYNPRLGDTMAARQPAVAQKKHQMFGKRMQQDQSVPSSMSQPGTAIATAEQMSSAKYDYSSYGMPPPVPQHNLLDESATATGGAVGGCPPMKHSGPQLLPEMKYSYSTDFARQNRNIHELINHNHTYSMPASNNNNNNGATPRPQIRDKKARNKTVDDEHLTRDEKRARSASIPMPVSDIINLPMDEFNERLSKYDLNETQLSLIRDIRRRGKNKVAAQNCRKRKLDQILSLADEVKEVRRRKERLLSEQSSIENEKKRIRNKFSALHRHIFQNLRDPDGNPYSPLEYSLQQSADGSVFLLPRDNTTDSSGGGSNPNRSHQNSSNKHGHGHNSHHHPHHHQSHRKE